MRKNNIQKGSLMIEMVAVIGLIALITPILFHQINRRNEEIINTQIATEMRAIRDAMTAYIQANEQTLAADVGIYDTSTQQYQNVSKDEGDCVGMVASDLTKLATYFQGNADILNEYDLLFCYHTVPVNEAEGTYRPVMYGVAVQLDGMGTIRRASKIASLIGLEGGVATSNNSLQGMQGVWSLPISDLVPTAVGVISSFDDASNASILKDVRWQHMQSDTAQADTMASQRMGVKEILTVDNTTNCIANYGNGTVQIKATNDTGSTCAPFFEVNPETKEVTLAGVITAESSEVNCAGLDEDTCDATNGCVFSQGICVGRYQIDPKYTSVMNDIKLTSRGGARLSDILPKWTLVGVETVETAQRDASNAYVIDTNNIQSSTTIDLQDWNCPTGYSKGALIIPTVFTLTAGRKSNVSGTTATLAENYQFVVSAAPLVDGSSTISVTIGNAIQAATVQKYCVWVDSESVKGASDPTTPDKNRPATTAE